MAELDVLRVFCAEDDSGGNALGVFLVGAEVAEEHRQEVARDLGYAETVFVDDRERGELRIFTPEVELPLAGHPLVGSAWLLRERGEEPAVLRPPAGDVGVRFDGELTAVSADPEWGPPFEFVELEAPGEVDSLGGPLDGYDLVGAWAWLDEEEGVIRERVFCPGAGIEEDEATGAAALRLCALLGRPIQIRQGRGSVIYAQPLGDGRAEISGRVVHEGTRAYEVPSG